MKTILIVRQDYEKEQTTGFALKLKENGYLEDFCRTLELPWRDNRRKVSCIPEGIYRGALYLSKVNGRCIALSEVKGRTGIQIHAGNYYTQTEGCILVGKSLMDINKDGITDVYRSGKALKELIGTDKQFWIEIRKGPLRDALRKQGTPIKRESLASLAPKGNQEGFWK